jgi:hypothetical protein
MGFSVSSTRLALILALLLACVPPIACQAPYWTQIGADFDGQARPSDQSLGESLGFSVSLSSDGTRAAFASNYGGDFHPTAGLARMYDYDGSDWTLIGTIEGATQTHANPYFVVNQVSLSSDGTRVAVAQRYYPERGLVRVFEYSGSAWVQVGADLLGDADGWGDQSGVSVSLSSDGSRIAIGALYNDGETSGTQNSNHGHVRVFEYDESSSSWMKVGGTCDQDFRCTGDIDGEAANDQSGSAVSLSGDGSRVAIGAPENDGAGLSAGHVRVFEYDGSTHAWTQIGQDIDGGGPDNRAGRFASLSADGSRVAIGANDYGGTDMSGHVRVYEYDGSSWVLMGSGIDGVKAGDYSCVVSLSSDGSRVAIGALYRDTRPEVPGPVRVFEYDGSDWVQLGFGLYGDANDIEAYDSLAVSLSGDGSRLAVGASSTTIGALTDAGRVRVFELFRPAEHPGWIFELVPTYSGIGQFIGAATAGDGRVVFAPANADHVGVYDPTDDSFTMVPFGVTGDPLIGMNGKFNGAVTAGDGRVVFVPSNANGVGVFNPTDDSFTLVPVGVTGDIKFNGAAVAGDGKVVFAPENAAGVGVFNSTDNSFSLVDISVTISTDYKFAGAATARDGRVVFAPLFALGVGIFDSTAPAGSQFTLVHVDKPQNANFVGAALAGDGRVVFPPIGGGGVGVFDPTDDTFTFVDISPTTARFHFAATLDDGRVVFAPYINPDAEEHGAGIFDATANRFTLVNTGTTSLDGITKRFSGAAVAPDGRVVFAPLSANGVGILKLPPCSCCETTMKSFGLHTNECKVVS